MLDTLFPVPIKARKAPQEIVHRIREQILNGKLERGNKLPSEQKLMSHFNVSRQTLREALRVLEVQGLLDIRAGSGGGAFVAEVDIETARMGLINFLHDKNLSISHLTTVRMLLEPYFVAEAARRMGEDDIAALEALQRRAHEALEENDPQTLREIEIEFHHRMGTFSGNPLLILIQDFIECLVRDAKRTLRPESKFSARVVKAHDAVLAGIKARKPEAAASAMRADIEAVGAALQSLANAHAPLKWR